MEVLSLLKHSLVSDCNNPILQHFRLVKLAASAGQEMVWKIYDAIRIKDGKVRRDWSFAYKAIYAEQ